MFFLCLPQIGHLAKQNSLLEKKLEDRNKCCNRSVYTVFCCEDYVKSWSAALTLL